MPKNERIRKTILFLISSGLVGLMYMGLLYFLKDVLQWQTYISVTIAYSSSMALYFMFNRAAVFKKEPDSKLGKQIFQFIILIIINYGITLLVIFAVSPYTGEIYSGSVLAGIITVTLTYFVFDRLLFKHKST